MNSLIVKEKKEYNLKTKEGQDNLREYIQKYNENIDPDDPIAKKIGIDEALAICNVEEYIRGKSNIAEIVREALEIGFTCQNFKTNTVFTFARQKLKKLNCNSIIRMQIENYIRFRMNNTDKNISEQKKQQDFENITTFKLNGKTFYYNILTGEELNQEQINEFLKHKKQGELLPSDDDLPF
jgi:hypothetical protein